jgi:FtsZ-binding cell division protein ZapB
METAMQYKTIVLEMLKERTALHEQLRQTHRLLPAMETYAKQLKASHQSWMETLSAARPGSDPAQISSEAMELALRELEDRLPPVSPQDESGLPTLEEATAYLVQLRPTRKR